MKDSFNKFLIKFMNYKNFKVISITLMLHCEIYISWYHYTTFNKHMVLIFLEIETNLNI